MDKLQYKIRKQVLDTLNQELRRIHGLLESENLATVPAKQLLIERKELQDHLITISKKENGMEW